MFVSQDTHSPLIIALDYADLNQALTFVDRIEPGSCRLKVGKEMFTLFGSNLVRMLQRRGFEVFLDLKFHDIPKTTAYAVAAAADLGVWMVNIHANGGARMMNAAREALFPMGKDAPLLVAVTVLTSIDAEDLREIGIERSPADQAELLARLTHQCGLDGVVCSAQEASRFKKTISSDFCLVTPGIRPVDTSANDHRRIMTPLQALQAGVNYIVIGRPITQSANPTTVLQTILNTLQNGRYN